MTAAVMRGAAGNALIAALAPAEPRTWSEALAHPTFRHQMFAAGDDGEVAAEFNVPFDERRYENPLLQSEYAQAYRQRERELECGL